MHGFVQAGRGKHGLHRSGRRPVHQTKVFYKRTATGFSEEQIMSSSNMGMSQRFIPSSDAEVFGYSPALRLLMFGCMVVFLVFAVFCAAVPFYSSRPSSVSQGAFGVAVFASFAAFTLNILRKLWDKVVIDVEGISYVPRGGATTVLAWTDVATVTANDIGQRIVLANAEGTKFVRVEYQLDRFARLREIVLARTAPLIRRHANTMTVFHRTWINKGIMIGIAAFFFMVGSLALVRHPSAQGLVLFAFALLPMAVIARDPSRLTINPDGVEIAYPIGTRRIRFAEISSVELTDVANRGNVWAAVILNLRIGKSVRLFRFREGSLALHEALRQAWTRAG